MPRPSLSPDHGYDAPTRVFHWLTAILILSAALIGYTMTRRVPATDADVSAIFRLYSLHKTIGVAVFFTALARIAWALTHRRPGPLHPDRRLETFAAELVHWALYGAMVMMPLSGWIYHAASPGYAPILWPLGQSLPFVPTDDKGLALFLSTLHRFSSYVLYAAIALHIAGAFKHAIVDMDATIARMTTGQGTPAAPARAHLVPALAALAIWAAAVATALTLAPVPEADPFAEFDAEQTAATGAPTWTMTDGSIAITVRQMGTPVTGTFTGWTADILYDEETRTGDVTVSIPVAGLTLGLVSKQALAPEFFDAAAHPTATFTATIAEIDALPTATGTLDLRGVSIPLSMPFDLTIDGDTATMSALITLDRRDFGMGAGYPDEKTVAFPVTVSIALTATRD
jgi:cytochrome b561/polyisoprenoid-binding protein YceI